MEKIVSRLADILRLSEEKSFIFSIKLSKQKKVKVSKFSPVQREEANK